MKKTILALAMLLALGANAGTYLHASDDLQWHYSLGGGYTRYADMYQNDGETVLGRLAISRDLKNMDMTTIGLELGFQTASQMRLNAPKRQYFDLGYTAVQTFVKPLADLLVTASTSFSQLNGVSGFVKAGIAYRQMHFDRDTLNSLRKINPEVQAGVSMQVSDNASLALGYQGIFAGKVGLHTRNPRKDLGQGTGTVNNIPTQNGFLIMLSMTA